MNTSERHAPGPHQDKELNLEERLQHGPPWAYESERCSPEPTQEKEQRALSSRVPTDSTIGSGLVHTLDSFKFGKSVSIFSNLFVLGLKHDLEM